MVPQERGAALPRFGQSIDRGRDRSKAGQIPVLQTVPPAAPAPESGIARRSAAAPFSPGFFSRARKRPWKRDVAEHIRGLERLSERSSESVIQRQSKAPKISRLH